MKIRAMLLLTMVAITTGIYADSLPEISITSGDVTHVKIVYGISETPTLEIHLKPGPTQAIHEFTQTNLLKTVSIRISGEVVSEPRVREAISGSTLELAINDEKKVIRLAKELTKKERRTKGL